MTDLEKLRRYMECLNVCHVCGDVLESPDMDGSIAAYTRCKWHGSWVDDSEDAPEWHIPRDDYEKRYVDAMSVSSTAKVLQRIEKLTTKEVRNHSNARKGK